MTHWQRWLLLASMVLCMTGLLRAQAPADPQMAEQERQADEVYMRGEGRMNVAAYEEAIDEFRTILKRFPDTQVRYKAQFRMADAYVALKKESDALTLLQSVVREESPEWSPQALVHIGEIYAGMQKYSEAFRAYRDIIAMYPNNPVVDHAHFAIGVTHFKLGHYELAAQELDKVGTVYASKNPDLQRVSPGDPVYIRLAEPNMVAAEGMKLPVTVTAKSGDTETIDLLPEAEGGDHFGASLLTELGAAKPGDKVLQLHGNDTVTLTYKSRYVGGGAVEKKVVMTIASSARLAVRDSENYEVRGIVVSDTLTVEVRDSDRDLTDKKDTVTVEVTTKKKDSEKVTLTETGEHTGVFEAQLKTMRGEPKPNSGAIETNADLAENSVTQLADNMVFTYQDEVHLSPTETGPRKVSLTLTLNTSSDGKAEAVASDIQKADLAIKALLYKGRSLTQIATTYNDLGQVAKATLTFRQAIDQFREVLVKYKSAPEVEDAMYGLYQAYVAQQQYSAAIDMINQITRRFPQSSRASQALFELASLHVKNGEYDRALGIYQSLVQSTKGTPLAEEAQYAICTTYMEMLRPKPGQLAPNTQITPEQIMFSLEEFARTFPTSERAPEALWQLARMRYDAEDYRGTVDNGRRMFATYPDHVMTGRVLLLMAQAQLKLRDREGAEQTLRIIIVNFGEQADVARSLLEKLQRAAAPSGGAGTAGGN